MLGVRLLLLTALALCALGLGASTAPASACGTSTYHVSGSVLEVLPGDGCTLTINAGGSETYALHSSGSSWAGTPVLPGWTAGDPTLIVLSAGITSIVVGDAPNEPSTVIIAGADQSGAPIPWVDALTVTQDEPGSSTRFAADVGLTAPISFGTSPVSVQSPSIEVVQDVVAASQISLDGTSEAPLIRGSLTTSGVLMSNGARIRTLGTTTLTASTTSFGGDVVGITGCAGVDVTICDTDPAVLRIVGALIAEGSVTDLSALTVTGNATLYGDVTTSGVQSWQGLVRVAKAGALTLTGSVVSTPQGVERYLGPCGSDVVTLCNVGAASPPATFTDFIVDGDWHVGGSSNPSGSLRVSGLTTVVGSGSYAAFAPTTAGVQDYLGGLSILLPRSATLSGSTITIAGMPEQVAAGSLGTAACDTGPVTVIGDLRLTGAVACAGSLLVNGATTIAADVSTLGYQSYQGPVTIALGSGSVRLRAPAGQLVSFPNSPVTATWSSANGPVAGYTASIAPTGQACSTVGALQCSFGEVPAGADLTFSATPVRPPATLPASATAQQASVVRRIVARGSQTRLTGLLRAPASLRGTRIWSERGPCAIRAGRLIAPQRAARCTVTLRVVQRKVAVWSGRAILTVR